MQARSCREDRLALSATTRDRRELGDVRPVRAACWSGLLGRGIQLSRTPAMHEAEGRAQGLAYVYRCSIPTRWARRRSAWPISLTFAEHFGFTGFNVTFPYKQEIIPLLDELSEAAETLGSVNTVVFRATAGASATTPTCGVSRRVFATAWPARRAASVLLLGAGGAGAAVAHALLESGVEQAACDRFASRSRGSAGLRLAARLAARFGGGRVVGRDRRCSRRRRADGIVNATPVGHGKAARHADRRRSAAAGVLGRRHRLLAARNGAARGGAASAAAARSAARAWRSSRRCGPLSFSPASRRMWIG